MPIKPIQNCVTLQEDITSEKCRTVNFCSSCPYSTATLIIAAVYLNFIAAEKRITNLESRRSA